MDDLSPETTNNSIGPATVLRFRLPYSQLSITPTPPASFHPWNRLPTELQREIFKYRFKPRFIPSIEDFRYEQSRILGPYYRTRNRKFCALARDVFYEVTTIRLNIPLTRKELECWWPPIGICRCIRRIQVRATIDISCATLEDVFSGRWPFPACMAMLLVPKWSSLLAMKYSWMSEWQDGLQSLTHLKLIVIPTRMEHHLRGFDPSNATTEDLVSLEKLEKVMQNTEVRLRAREVEIEIAGGCPWIHEGVSCPVETLLTTIIRRMIKQPEDGV
ncbi:hypothetical protein BDV96DRAFT_95434 [Lophiotrema nucula]|uniref:Uncharacterized protein n=1 Tax=Lophiotrema nucula TaxID=690887 RepID=A0A6A5Z4N5_9PLEO|nr:hypothetical protein BDV96DRAFT_95434 [Lophiotrema nucula]